MPVIHALVARGADVLAEYSSTTGANDTAFETTTAQEFVANILGYTIFGCYLYCFDHLLPHAFRFKIAHVLHQAISPACRARLLRPLFAPTISHFSSQCLALHTRASTPPSIAQHCPPLPPLALRPQILDRLPERDDRMSYV
jgi:hypothetical protein